MDCRPHKQPIDSASRTGPRLRRRSIVDGQTRGEVRTAAHSRLHDQACDLAGMPQSRSSAGERSQCARSQGLPHVRILASANRTRMSALGQLQTFMVRRLKRAGDVTRQIGAPSRKDRNLSLRAVPPSARFWGSSSGATASVRLKGFLSEGRASKEEA